VYDRIFGDFPAKHTVCTPYIYGSGQPYSQAHHKRDCHDHISQWQISWERSTKTNGACPNVPISKCSNVQMHQCTIYHGDKYLGREALKQTERVQMYQCPNVPMYHISQWQISWERSTKTNGACPNVPMSKCTIVQMYQSTNVQMCLCPNVPISKCTNFQMSKCTNVQMYQCPNEPMYQCAIVQMCNVYVLWVRTVLANSICM